jgi:hypothetical protein
MRDNDPDAVVVQHAELAPMVRERDGRARWILDLHDAFPATTSATPDFEAFTRDVARYDALTVCSAEDAAWCRIRASRSSPTARTCSGAVRPLAGRGIAVRRAVPLRPEPRGHRSLPARRVASRARGDPEPRSPSWAGDESLEAARDPLFAQPGVQSWAIADDVPRLLAQGHACHQPALASAAPR